MIYFDHAATGGLKPPEVLRAVHAALAVSANPGRSGHRLSMAAAERVYRTRRLLDEYFSGYGPERVVFTKNCTEALNIAIHSLQGHVVTTELEHNSVLRPLFARGNYSICPLKNGAIEVDLLLSYLRADTVALVITLASNVTGYAPDIKALRKKLPPSVLLICDGAQYCGHKRLSLREWGIDALAVAGHKGMYGIQGSGALLFSERFSPVPLLQGGTGTDSTSLAMPEYYPERLESGTLNYPAIVSLHEGVLYLKSQGEADLMPLNEKLHKGIARLPYRLYSQPNPFGICSFSHQKLSSEEIASILSEKYSICVRGGYHCAPLVHESVDLDGGGSVRVSLGFGNTAREVGILLSALSEIAGKRR